MELTLNALIEKLQRKVRSQKTPIPYTDEDYKELVIEGIKTLYIDLNKESEFPAGLSESDGDDTVIDLTIAKQEYVLNAAIIGFYQDIQGNVNTIVGYSTNALSVTNADKPYANIASEINKLQDRQIELFHKIRAAGD